MTSRAVTSRPLAEGNFIPLARHGLGDAQNTYVHSMAWFRDHLYVGMTRNALCGGRPYDRAPEYQIYPVKVPDVPWDLDWRARIWRYDMRDARWENVHVSPMCLGSRGFEIPRHYGFRDMAVFEGASDREPALYTVAWGSHMGPGPFVLRSSDGTHFDEVGGADRRRFGSQTLRALVPFEGRLFTAPVGRCGGTDTFHDKTLVLASEDPATGSWRPASKPYFGDENNLAVFDLAVSGGHLYAGTMNPQEGCQVWKTNGKGGPPYCWSKIICQGAFRGKLNEVAISLCEFRGSIYVGSAIYNCGYDRIYKIGPAAPELIRINPDDSWDLIVGEPRHTPDGLKIPLSGLGPGFNNPFTGYIWRLCVHEGWLYAGTCVWTPWAPFARRDKWPKAMKEFFEHPRSEHFIENFGGFDLWRSRDGERWVPVTRSGFGNPYNCGVRAMVSTPFGLAVGVVNQFGPEVAVKRAAGWRYEPNERGGVEVWLGAREPLGNGVATALADAEPRRRTALPTIAGWNSHGSALVAEYYGHSDWRNVGFWRADIAAARQACENLVEELLAFTRPDPPLLAPRYPTDEELAQWLEKRSSPEREAASATHPSKIHARIIDLGCGLGASTRYLLKYFAPEMVTGVTDDRAALQACRLEASPIRFCSMSLPALRFETNSFQYAICVEGPGRWGNRRTLLREARRVLQPGGRLVASDMVTAGDADGLEDSSQYRKLLAEVGFAEVRVVDASRWCWSAFRRHSRRYLWKKWLSGTSADVIRHARASLPGGFSLVRKYLLISARKPG